VIKYNSRKSAKLCEKIWVCGFKNQYQFYSKLSFLNEISTSLSNKNLLDEYWPVCMITSIGAGFLSRLFSSQLKVIIACLHDQNKSASQRNLKSFQKAPIGWKKADTPKKPLLF